MRNPASDCADLRAQRAANLTGERRLAELVERRGADRLRRDGGDPRIRRATLRGGDRCAAGRRLRGQRRARGGPDGGADIALRVSVTIADDRLRLDFTGTRRTGRRQPQLPARQ